MEKRESKQGRSHAEKCLLRKTQIEMSKDPLAGIRRFQDERGPGKKKREKGRKRSCSISNTQKPQPKHCNQKGQYTKAHESRRKGRPENPLPRSTHQTTIPKRKNHQANKYGRGGKRLKGKPIVKKSNKEKKEEGWIVCNTKTEKLIDNKGERTRSSGREKTGGKG